MGGGRPSSSLYLMAQGSAPPQIMHTSVSARDSRHMGLLPRALTSVAWIFGTLHLTAPTDTKTKTGCSSNAGRIAV